MTKDEEEQLLDKPSTDKKLTLIPLIFLIYFEVAGGAYGTEPAVQAAGVLYTLLGFLIFPFVWGIPVSLVTAELATAIPGNGGPILWAHGAFGPFTATVMGSWKFLNNVINIAAFPILCADYLARVLPPLSNGAARSATVAGMNLLLSALNYMGLSIVGYVAVAIGAATLTPYFLMIIVSLPRIKPARWVHTKRQNDWRLFLNTLFWNLNYWDNASAMAGEVERPHATFPKALLASGVAISLSYILPLMAGTGAVSVEPDAWTNGYFADVAGFIGGKWLKYWIEVGAVLSAVAMYEAQLSASAFQLLGMANLGLLPSVFARRGRWFNTPWVGILMSSLVTFVVSFMSFNDVVSSANFLYNLTVILEFAAFVWLRKDQPSLKRPYNVPFSLFGALVLSFVPTMLVIVMVVFTSTKVMVISLGLAIFGVVLHHVMRFCITRGFVHVKNDASHL